MRPVTSCTKNRRRSCPSVRPVCAERLGATVGTRREVEISQSIQCLLYDRSLIAYRVIGIRTFCRTHAAFYPVGSCETFTGVN